MKNYKTSNLIFTIDVEDFKNNEQILDALASAIHTSLKLNKDKNFGRSMRDSNLIFSYFSFYDGVIRTFQYRDY